MGRAGRHGARREVGRRADVADDAAPRDEAQQRGILDGADAVRDPDGREALQRFGDGVGAGPFARVRDRHEAEAPRAAESAGEVPRRERGLVATEAEAEGAPPGVPFVEIEDTLGGRRPPVPHDVEQDDDSAVPRGLVGPKDRLERRAYLEPVEAELLGDGGRNVDFGVADALAGEARGEAARDECVVVSRANLPADVAVKGEERASGSEQAPPRADGAEIRENGCRRAGREAYERRRGDRALEVQVELDRGRRREAAKKTGGGRSDGHADASYGVLDTGPVPLGAPPRGRLWMRAAAFGVDLLLVAGGPLLVASAIVFGIAAVAEEPPVGLDEGFRAAQILAILLFLLRDAAGGSPGKKLFGLRLIRRGGTPAGPVASLARNLTLFVPIWNLVEIVSVIHRRDGRRPGDKLAGTTLVEA